MVHHRFPSVNHDEWLIWFHFLKSEGNNSRRTSERTFFSNLERCDDRVDRDECAPIRNAENRWFPNIHRNNFAPEIDRHRLEIVHTTNYRKHLAKDSFQRHRKRYLISEWHRDENGRGPRPCFARPRAIRNNWRCCRTNIDDRKMCCCKWEKRNSRRRRTIGEHEQWPHQLMQP